MFDQIFRQDFDQGLGEGKTINTVYSTTRPKEKHLWNICFFALLTSYASPPPPRGPDGQDGTGRTNPAGPPGTDGRTDKKSFEKPDFTLAVLVVNLPNTFLKGYLSREFHIMQKKARKSIILRFLFFFWPPYITL